MKEYEIIRSARHTLSVEVTVNSKVLVRAPYRATRRDIEEFVIKEQDWIERHVAKMNERRRQRESMPVPRIGADEVHELAARALNEIPPRVKAFATEMGVTYGRITIRNQRTLWGSCSSRGNLNFNCLLMKTPVEIQDYVIVHELAHRKHMDHSPAFWAEVEKVVPDYRERRKWLRRNGGQYIEGMKMGNNV